MFLMMDCRATRLIRWSQAEGGAKIFGSAALACEVEMQQGLCEQEVLNRCHNAMENRIPSAYRTSGLFTRWTYSTLPIVGMAQDGRGLAYA
jgi:hypothetical protein